MKDSNFDKRIKAALDEAVKDILPPDDMLYSIKNISAEEQKMKKFDPIKTAVVCIAAVMALSVGVIGAGKLLYIESHSSILEAINHFPTEKELDKIIDYKPRYIEKLGKYDFESCVPVHSSNIGENGEKLDNYTGMSFEYKTEKGILVLDTDPKPMEINENISEILEYNGIKYYYSSYLYKTVPPDYQLTEEDEKLQKEGKLQIGVGSDKVEEMNNQSICWEQDGISYCLLDMGVGIDKTEFESMAKSIIDIK